MQRKTIGLFTYKVYGLDPWDPDTIRTGITGSEEAVIYLAQALAEAGHQVTVFADPPPHSRYTSIHSNPRFVDANERDGSLFDIGIVWRLPQLAYLFRHSARAFYFWPHDSLNCLVPPELIDLFTDVFWLSKWQRLQWMSVNPAFGQFVQCIGNGIDERQFVPVKPRANPYSCIYGSNYAYGLEILLHLWPDIKRRFPQATLDIYYGWQHWGLLTPQKEAWMRKTIPTLEGVHDHGLVGHSELNRAYATSSFWTYACMIPETFCITALRAQLSGAIPIVIQRGALSQTVRHGYQCIRAEDYYPLWVKAMEEVETLSLDDRRKMGSFVLREYTWRAVADRMSACFC